MIANRSVLGLIPARGGSKGIPRKNLRQVAGKPLIAWAIEQGKNSKYIDRLVLSSDDEEIIRIAAEFGCEAPFRRPSELATDETPGIEPVLHAIRNLPSYDYVVLLQPTSPLRTAEDIDACVSLCIEHGAPACVSVTQSEAHPYHMFWRDEKLRMTPLLQEGQRISRRQELPPVFLLNGAVYVAECSWLREKKSFVTQETICYEMPLERSADIDTEADLQRMCNTGLL